MLQITIPPRTDWDEQKEEFVEITKGGTLQLEHSLVSLSKWESKWKKPFLDNSERTNEESIDYIRCMTVTRGVDQSIYLGLTEPIIRQVVDYINDPMTATWFSKEEEKKAGINREKITAEIIYYWMIAMQIPFECQKWHLNRLLTLIRVCNIKNSKPKPMSKKELRARNKALNAARRKRLNSRG